MLLRGAGAGSETLGLLDEAGAGGRRSHHHGRRKHSDDGDDDQQLDEGEPLRAPRPPGEGPLSC